MITESRAESMKAYQNALITAAYREVESHGWPTLMDDYDMCMERTMEFLTKRDAIIRGIEP